VSCLYLTHGNGELIEVRIDGIAYSVFEPGSTANRYAYMIQWQLQTEHAQIAGFC